jgi:hypothetical protein
LPVSIAHPPTPGQSGPKLPWAAGDAPSPAAGPASSDRQGSLLVRFLARGKRILLLATALLLLLLSWLAGPARPAFASLDNDHYDGNIFALYAGNGSLVPPRTTLAEAIAAHRVAVVIYYLDDSSVSKRFAPVVSELQRIWGNSIELIPLVTDPLLPGGGKAGGQASSSLAVGDSSRYWSGLIPQVVVLNSEGQPVFDASGQVEIDAINAALSAATGLPLPALSGLGSTRSFNELNSEVVSSGQ